MIDSERYSSKVKTIAGAIRDYSTNRRSVQADRSYSEEYKREQIDALFGDASEIISNGFRAMREGLDSELLDARAKAETDAPGFAERTYNAITAKQDAEGRSPEEILAIYDRAVQRGNRVYMKELERIADPMIGEGEFEVVWNEMKAANRTPEERDALETERSVKAIGRGLLPLENHARYLLENSHGGSTVDPDELSVIWEQSLVNAGLV